MNSAFGWIGRIFDGLMQFLPRRVIVTPAFRCVAFVGGGTVRELRHDNGWPLPVLRNFRLLANPRFWRLRNFVARSGIHVYLPLITEVHNVDTTVRVADLSELFIVDDDGQPVCIRPVVSYRIVDPIRVATKCPGLLDLIDELSVSAVSRYVIKASWKEITSPTADDKLTAQLSDDLSEFGVQVIRATLGGRQRVKAHAMWGLNLNVM